MKIDEAVKQALSADGFIWSMDFPDILIKPYHGIPCTVVNRDGSNFANCWNPTSDDLLSDKWFVYSETIGMETKDNCKDPLRDIDRKLGDNDEY